MSKEVDPRMHSAEHLLNQTMVRTFGCDRCFSAHLNRKKSKCDYLFDRLLSKLEISQLQEKVNQEIEKDHWIVIENLSKADAQARYNIERVPGKDALTQLRIVWIGDYDACPCIGPHVSSTRQIGVFKITGVGFDAGVLRIRFKLG